MTLLSSEVDELQKQVTDTATADTIKELRLRNAFLIAAIGKVREVDAAYRLADLSAVAVNDNGTVSDVDGVLATVLERYPYLAADDEPAPFDDPEPFLPSSGRPSTQYGSSPLLRSRR